MIRKIGFMGLGTMGSAMATNILKGGYSLVIYNRTQEKTDTLRELGAEIAASPQVLASVSDAVITMVTGPKALADLLWGNQGAAQALTAEKVFINTSTVSPRFTREMTRRLLPTGATVIDAPVSGSRMAAEEGSLLVLAGGDRERIATVTPLLETFARKVVYCGDVGSGSMMKITINFLLASMMEGLAEALTFGKTGGLSTGTILEVIQAGPLGCALFGNKASMILEDDFPASLPLKQITKDLKFMLDTAYDSGANVPTGSVLLQLYRLGVSQGWGELDFSAIVKVLEYLGKRE